MAVRRASYAISAHQSSVSRWLDMNSVPQLAKFQGQGKYADAHLRGRTGDFPVHWTIVEVRAPRLLTGEPAITELLFTLTRPTLNLLAHWIYVGGSPTTLTPQPTSAETQPLVDLWIQGIIVDAAFANFLWLANALPAADVPPLREEMSWRQLYTSLIPSLHTGPQPNTDPTSFSASLDPSVPCLPFPDCYVLIGRQRLACHRLFLCQDGDNFFSASFAFHSSNTVCLDDLLEAEPQSEPQLLRSVVEIIRCLYLDSLPAFPAELLHLMLQVSHALCLPSVVEKCEIRLCLCLNKPGDLDGNSSSQALDSQAALCTQLLLDSRHYDLPLLNRAAVESSFNTATSPGQLLDRLADLLPAELASLVREKNVPRSLHTLLRRCGLAPKEQLAVWSRFLHLLASQPTYPGPWPVREILTETGESAALRSLLQQWVPAAELEARLQAGFTNGDA